MDRCLRFIRTHMTIIAIGVALLVLALVSPKLSAAGGSLLVLGAVIPTDDLIRALAKQNLLDAAGGFKRNVKEKTADYTILSPATSTLGDPSGTLFTNRGAGGAVNFTLPAPTQLLAGVWYDFLAIANQNILVLAATADTLVVVNDAAADSLAISTSSQKIGSCMRAICDGTAWIAYGTAIGAGGDTGTNTYTVAT